MTKQALPRSVRPAAVKAARAEAAAADAVIRHIGVDLGRADAYRIGYARLMRLCYLMSFAVIGSVGVLAFMVVSHVPQDRYFAETAEGAMMEVVSLDRPYVTQQALFDWSADAAAQVMTFGFNDYNDKLSAAQNKFTEKGWASFAQEMSGSAFFKNVVNQRQLITSVPAESPLILFEGYSAGKFSWVVEVTLMTTVRSGSLSNSLRQRVRLTIVPVPTAVNPMGIAIDQWVSF